MIIVVDNDENLYELFKRNPLPIVLYGAGRNIKKYISRISNFDMICDKNRIGDIVDGYTIKSNKEIESLGKKVYVVVTVSSVEVFEEIKKELEGLTVSIYLVHACNNVAFSYDYWNKDRTYYVSKKEGIMKINLVCDDDSWIFRKFSDKMYEILSNERIIVYQGKDTRSDVDINHHIPYAAYRTYKNDTLMITHIDSMDKVQAVRKQLEFAGMGICMSKDTMDKLTSYGIDRGKLCYVNPAHDSIIKPHKYLIGITHKCRYPMDVRKRETALIDMLEGIDNNFFKFFIMGSGWDFIIESLKVKGFEVEYYSDFDYEIYVKKMQDIDYYLYMGFDEGSMGFLDALTAGSGTIVTPQGYHLDVPCEIDYPCNNIKEFYNAFKDLEQKRKKKIEAVSEWTWENYTQKHVMIWEYLLKRRPLGELFKKHLFYNDGFYSIMLKDNKI